MLIPRNVDPLIARLIAGGKCTLVELKEKLDLEDAYVILESEYVATYNDNVLQQRAIDKAKRESDQGA